MPDIITFTMTVKENMAPGVIDAIAAELNYEVDGTLTKQEFLDDFVTDHMMSLYRQNKSKNAKQSAVDAVDVTIDTDIAPTRNRDLQIR